MAKVGEIISRFEKKGFLLKGLKLFQCPKELAEVRFLACFQLHDLHLSGLFFYFMLLLEKITMHRVNYDIICSTRIECYFFKLCQITDYNVHIYVTLF